ncbi:tRNA pseudouridine(38/39) synthase [Purpureocillium takamizusanense]|uniref:tRNA pseudouridine(38/39) synthase n=1 Tax=Purpureocillium takamizusanense TaxID=2060973 RepID=A0A9Q8QJA4_9HYPO|nr:tRNA pseudouridine(38/39) synthase [Purpureocillium takamizusanense]UNI19846.1 tRNA pseudouridine(38/39) synthase [Purpureocillium takamizusanense]
MRPFCGHFGRSVSAGILDRAGIRSTYAQTRQVSSSPSSARSLRLPRGANPNAKMAGEGNYNAWTKTGLIQRVRELEVELAARPAAPTPAEPAETGLRAPDTIGEDGTSAAVDKPKAKPPKGKRKMDPSRYSTRFIALKLAYLGKNYGGFEFQAMGNQPSIEEELWNALTKACLIFPEDERVVQFDCCEYSKCGRTDRGVSAFGQVVGLRVRSNRPLPKKRAKLDVDGAVAVEQRPDEMMDVELEEGVEEDQAQEKPFDDAKDELCYPRILNRLLPKDIRILAWCPSPPPDFSARFSCRERQYRYFFTQPAFTPEPSLAGAGAGTRSTGGVRTGWLDIEAMRDAAKRFEGEHDFRNVCKVDPAKQITNFRRRIFESDVVEVKDVASALPYLGQAGFAAGPGMPTAGEPYPKVYYFHVRGSAFLWHQIRHMVALLFLVGQGLEKPSLISELLDVTTNPRKPSYVMADEVPLVLWDCLFPDLDEEARRMGAAAADGGDRVLTERTDALEWIYVGDEYAPNKYGQFGVVDGLWELWRERKMDELLANQLLQLVSQQGVPAGTAPTGGGGGRASASARVYEGGNAGRLAGKYVPVMRKEMMQSPEEQNDKYARRKGYASAEDMREQKGMGRPRGDEATSDE